MTKRLVPLFILLCLLASCAPAPASPTSTPTATVVQTRTPRPTQTAIPTVTPYPPLRTDGPHLLITYDKKNFTIMDADGSGRKQFQLPNDGYVANWRPESSISPDGKWLAYFTGSTDEPYDIALNLLNLENATTIKIVDLIAQDFPQNLETAVEIFNFEGCPNNTECEKSLFRIGLIEGIESLQWSPDGKHLAFAAQIDGFSSDIYAFTMEDRSITQLTNEPENIYRIFWSPAGDKILYDTSVEGTDFFIETTWRVVDLKLTTPQNPKIISEERSWRRLGWFSDDLFFISEAIDGSLSYINTSYIDISSKETVIIWPFITESMIFDFENNRILLSLIPYDDKTPKITQGTYVLYLDGTSIRISDEFVYLFPEQISFDSYLAVDNNNSLISISPDGSIINFAQTISYRNTPRVSPDKRWLIIMSDNVTSLFSESIELIESWDIEASAVIWRTDSTGAFLYDRDKLYYLSLPEGILTSVDDCISKSCRQFFRVWLP
jgi:Tol biopolymer transport system component